MVENIEVGQSTHGSCECWAVLTEAEGLCSNTPPTDLCNVSTYHTKNTSLRRFAIFLPDPSVLRFGQGIAERVEGHREGTEGRGGVTWASS